MKRKDDKEPLGGGDDIDPFEEYSSKGTAAQDPADGAGKKPQRLKPAKRIAYAAVSAAIASVMALMTVFLPVKVTPLIVAAFCFYLAYRKCGIFYGILSAVAATLITLTGGVNTSLVLLAVCFFPYSLLCLPLRRFDYRSVNGALIRIAVVTVFVNVAFVAVYFIAKYAVLGGVDIIGAVGKLGDLGYLFAALILTAAAIAADFLFVLCDKAITPKIK